MIVLKSSVIKWTFMGLFIFIASPAISDAAKPTHFSKARFQKFLDGRQISVVEHSRITTEDGQISNAHLRTIDWNGKNQFIEDLNRLSLYSADGQDLAVRTARAFAFLTFDYERQLSTHKAKLVTGRNSESNLIPSDFRMKIIELVRKGHSDGIRDMSEEQYQSSIELRSVVEYVEASAVKMPTRLWQVIQEADMNTLMRLWYNDLGIALMQGFRR